MLFRKKELFTHKNLREKVYQETTAYFLSPADSPGMKLQEETVAKILGVRRTPIRKALFHLAHEGIVELISNRRYFKIK